MNDFNYSEMIRQGIIDKCFNIFFNKVKINIIRNCNLKIYSLFSFHFTEVDNVLMPGPERISLLRDENIGERGVRQLPTDVPRGGSLERALA